VETTRDETSLQALTDKEKQLDRQYTIHRVLHFALIAVVVAVVVIVPLLVWQYRGWVPIYAFIAYGIIPVAFLPMSAARLKRLEEEQRELAFEIDMETYAVSDDERRAEKMLRRNREQLRRYYDLNLSQNVWAFLLGIGCICIGVAIIAVTFHLVTTVAADTNARIAVAALGAVGSIVSNAVAAVFLKMYAATANNLTDFHARLVKTHQLYFCNLLSSRIENDEIRWRTMRDAAIEMAENVD
jgi:hypothetical protein